ncbi:MAG: hypothetical protein CVU23_09535 [Betaproteobacteria bacterium HGW-Betaproteobacteria-17]|nr:MAG: hypothetical protein CVU23_09535 [Betaproteobacteria bacterium HGW-Betaproteobacteria-17]
MTSVVDAIRSCKYLYLDAIREPEENQLSIVLLEAIAGATLTEEDFAAEPNESIRAMLAGSKAIEHVEGCMRFELSWQRYIGYSVVNESYSNGEPESSNGRGRLLVEYEKSNYLEYLSRASFASTDYPGPFKHWAIHCLNHTIDVASQDAPIARVLP